jgi:hypothetical protein
LRAVTPHRGHRRLEDQISRLAFSYTAGIVLAPPDAPTAAANTIVSGSGFVLKLERGCFLCTAWTVVEQWITLRAAGGDVRFQVGSFGLDPRERLAWKNEDDDLTFLHLLPDELPRIGVQPYEPAVWPPSQPRSGEYVVIATARLEVGEVRERSVLCARERDDLDLRGMSGGPVVLVGNLVHPIVGIVPKVSSRPDSGLLRITTLAHVHDLPAHGAN